MKYAFTYHDHVIVADTSPAIRPLPLDAFHSDGVEVSCPTASMPYVIVQAVVFAVKHNVRSLVIDGVELKITNLPKTI